jgi:hypothetical protein
VLRPASPALLHLPRQGPIRAIGIVYVRAFSLDSARQAVTDSKRTATLHYDITAAARSLARRCYRHSFHPHKKHARQNDGGSFRRPRPPGLYHRLGPQRQRHEQGRDPGQCGSREAPRGRLQVQDAAEHLAEVRDPAQSLRLQALTCWCYRFIGVSDLASVRFSLPAQLLEPRPNLGMFFTCGVCSQLRR